MSDYESGSEEGQELDLSNVGPCRLLDESADTEITVIEKKHNKCLARFSVTSDLYIYCADR